MLKLTVKTSTRTFNNRKQKLQHKMLPNLANHMINYASEVIVVSVAITMTAVTSVAVSLQTEDLPDRITK